MSLIIDTDTFNEVDDQFAVVHALLSPEKLDVQALYAAPFFNNRSVGPADGMEKSYNEILRLLERMDISPAGLVFRGAGRFLPHPGDAVASDAAADLIDRAMARSEKADPLYVVAIAALTNIASAILLQPEIIRRIVVVWLGGNGYHWPDTHEFNLSQDIAAARVVFDCGVPLVHLPCRGVVTHLHTTVAELERYAAPHGPIGSYLTETVKDYRPEHRGWSKVLWDMAAVAYLLNPSWTPGTLVHSPVIGEDGRWGVDKNRHMIRTVYHVFRDPVFEDFFNKLEQRNWK